MGVLLVRKRLCHIEQMAARDKVYWAICRRTGGWTDAYGRQVAAARIASTLDAKDGAGYHRSRSSRSVGTVIHGICCRLQGACEGKGHSSPLECRESNAKGCAHHCSSPSRPGIPHWLEQWQRSGVYASRILGRIARFSGGSAWSMPLRVTRLQRNTEDTAERCTRPSVSFLD
jgi:hypothetical protein